MWLGSWGSGWGLKSGGTNRYFSRIERIRVHVEGGLTSGCEQCCEVGLPICLWRRIL